MKLSKLEYILPNKNIAHSPTDPRDHAKLLLLNKMSGEIKHKHFYDLPQILTSNDVLVFNNTKVFPARLFAGKIEILLLRELENNTWTAMHRGKVTIGEILDFNNIHAKIISKKDYEITLQFVESRENILIFIQNYGKMPLPPYIKSPLSEPEIRNEYQTVYALKNGSVASPTAGLHFTKQLIQSIKDSSVQIEYVTLHVGAGTFLPIKEQDLTKHLMHSEYFEIDDQTIERLNTAKKEKKRIIAVGTTTTRVLESITTRKGLLSLHERSGNTNIFIYPPYKFKFIDSLITNFHLPHSTLLALVSAFVSEPNTQFPFRSFKESIIGHAYQEAIERNYRFYSFGDGMLIG